MADTETIRTAFERNAKAVSLRASIGRSTGRSIVRLHDGTTCEIEGSGWTLTADVGTAQGGNNAGPGPGVLERGALGSCLAIGYVTWAAHLGVPIENLRWRSRPSSTRAARWMSRTGPPGSTPSATVS